MVTRAAALIDSYEGTAASLITAYQLYGSSPAMGAAKYEAAELRRLHSPKTYGA